MSRRTSKRHVVNLVRSVQSDQLGRRFTARKDVHVHQEDRALRVGHAGRLHRIGLRLPWCDAVAWEPLAPCRPLHAEPAGHGGLLGRASRHRIRSGHPGASESRLHRLLPAHVRG